MTAMLTRIRLQAEGATIPAVQETLFAAADSIHTLIYTAAVVPPHPLAGEHYEQAPPPDRYHTRWYTGRCHLDFPIDHHAVEADRLRSRDRELRGFDRDHGTFAGVRYEAREYAWEGTGTPEAHATYGVYDTAVEADLEGHVLPGEREAGLVTGGLTQEQAERGAAALNMTAHDARFAIYHAAMPGFYPPDRAPWADEKVGGIDDPVIVATDTLSLARKLAEALRTTQEYAGSGLLKALPGWAWFDALNEYADAVGDPRWRPELGEEEPLPPPPSVDPPSAVDPENPSHGRKTR